MIEQLASDVLAGKRRALAKAITLVSRRRRYCAATYAMPSRSSAAGTSAGVIAARGSPSVGLAVIPNRDMTAVSVSIIGALGHATFKP